MDVAFDVQDVTYQYPGAPGPALEGVAFQVGAGELLAVVGPNGSGKTTLLRLLLGVISPARGQVLVAGRAASGWDRPELARLVGVVAQREEPAFPLRVRSAAMLGRYPHLGPLSGERPGDLQAVDRALARCDVTHLGERWVATLSGGEWQRVRIARALAQEPQALVLDEPTANLDIGHEMELFELVSRLVREDGLAGIVITHHVNLAARYADRLIVLNHGRLAAAGSPETVVTRDLLEPVFGWPVEIQRWRSSPQFVPLKRSETSP